MTPRKPHKKQSSAIKVAGKLFRESYFPTFIYYRDVPGTGDLNDDLKKKIYAWKRRDEAGIVRSNMSSLGSWHSAVDMNQHEEFSELVDLIDLTMEQVYENQGYDSDYKPVCDNMWANINPRYGYNRTHNHPNVLWSGVYYVQAPPDSGRIYLTDPRVQATMVTPHLSKDAGEMRDTWKEVYFEPITGRMLIFPAWLSHEVQPNLTSLKGRAADRISIAFNYVQQLRT